MKLVEKATNILYVFSGTKIFRSVSSGLKKYKKYKAYPFLISV